MHQESFAYRKQTAFHNQGSDAQRRNIRMIFDINNNLTAGARVAGNTGLSMHFVSRFIKNTRDTIH